ncbi:MAG TPA: alanine racemase [Bacteroidales bacterium]|nr:alanine racemase [Bacteroidales bacterium]HOF75135.1 alanine racemase [Bacteroidales bacterium]HOQ96283.1 alanine racemase [Bacteroidales bacterium]
MNDNQFTHLEINIPNIRHNLNYFRSFLNKKTKLLVLVKAYGYGHGIGEFSRILEENGVDYLAVAFPGEGVAIREAGVKLPVIVLSAGMEHYSLLIKNQLEPSLPCLEAFRRFSEEAAVMGEKGYPAHIKLDTGMHRLGFEEEELRFLADELPLTQSVRIASIFSHFVASGDPRHDDFTRTQIARFESLSSFLMQHLDYRPIRHLLNSPGIERFAKEAEYDMVRLGIGIYGMSYVDRSRLRPTAYLKTPVLQVKTVAQGETVGYARAGVVTAPGTHIATLAIGYADGVNRHLSGGKACFSVNGHRAPTIGNICMDMCMIDVTGIDVNPGDMVTVFGDDPTIFELAEILGTIPYEILTSVAHRVPRIYVE